MSIKEKTTNYILDKVAINDRNWEFYARIVVKSIDKFPRLVSHTLLRKIFLKMAKIWDPEKHHTQGWIVPLNHDLKYEQDYQNVVLPIELVRKAIEESSYRAIMNKCMCRAGHKCTHYPIDLGCIFMGKAAKHVVENNVAREASVKEALAHIDRAAKIGLLCMCGWMEIERILWGIRLEEQYRFLEICFCCPCCCLAFRNFARMPVEFTQRARSIGWVVSEVTCCTMCGKCIEICPLKARSINGDTVTVSDTCFGCGLCAINCPEKAIVMKQKSETKERIQDYLIGLNLDI